MFRKKFSELKVGLFVLIAVIIVLATIFWARGFLMTRSQMDMIAYFQKTSGLNEGDPVSVKGVEMGRVSSIELVGDSIRVDFTLDETVKIKEDYKIEVAMLELMGGKKLYITPGKSSVEIDYSKPLYGRNSVDFLSLMNSVSELSVEVKTLIQNFSKTNDRLNEVLININDIVGDRQMKMDLKSTAANFEVTSRNLNALVSENRVSLRNLTGKVEYTIDNVNEVMDDSSPEFKETIKEMHVLTTKVDTLVTNLNVIVSDIHNQESSVGKFMYDEEFYENINKTLKEIEELTKKIRKEGVKINLF
ncbi:MAG: MCE family protein [Ignavibacteria bacterium]|nr:MCE family protein [Ignavibacteria bacterium]